MVEVPSDHPTQGDLRLAAHLCVGPAPTVGHVGHDQDAQLVGPVQLARDADLDVDPLAVETDLARPQDLVAHERVARERVEPFGVIRLVERQLQIDGLVVQRDVGQVGSGQVDYADLPHPEVSRDDVFGPLARQDGLDLVEVRIFERPEPHRFDGHVELDFLASLGDGRLCGACGAIFGLELDRQTHRVGRRLVQRGLDGDLAGVDVRQEVHGFQRDLGPGLQIDRLPDALGRAVALLAFELERMRRVVDAQREGLVPVPLDMVGQLELERRVPALEAADLLAVEPAGRQPVAGADHDEDAASLPVGRYADRPLVPRDVGLVLDAGQLRAPRERHVDRQRKLRLAGRPVARQPRVLLVETELPRAVQVDPQRPLKVRPGMLRQRDVLSP